MLKRILAVIGLTIVSLLVWMVSSGVLMGPLGVQVPQ